MQTSPRYGRASQSYPSKPQQRRSGYEPSDTETDFQESPWRDHNKQHDNSHIELVSDSEPRLAFNLPRNTSPLKSNRRSHSSRFDHRVSPPPAKNNSSEASDRRRHSSKSPYKPRRDDHNNEDNTRSVLEPNRRQQERNISSKRANYPSKRSMTAPRMRQAAIAGPTSGELNERAAYAKMARNPPPHLSNPPAYDSTGSISPGDIFFSREWTASALPKKTNAETNKNTSSLSSQTATMFSSSGSRQGSGRFSTESSKLSEASDRTTDSARRFTAERRKKSQKETWFGCVKKGSCRTSKSPEKNQRSTFNETLYIEKALVVEKLRQFWADKYRPRSLSGFTCHKPEALLLKQLVSDYVCPHILLKGPNGSGKRSLAMALLREIYGDASCDVSHDLRHFQVQENRPMQVVVPVTSSAHHIELNVFSEPKAKYALLGLVREITKDRAVTPEISTVDPHLNYKVIVLYDVDKATDNNIQHLIKWILDCYTDSCRLILCCEDDAGIIESVTSRCRVIKIDAPVTHETMEVLIQISRKEDFELPMGFAAKIAIKSKQNLRKAIMALEACKAHNYPFIEDQPIPIGWEEVSIEMATEILANPASSTLFQIRGRFQKLLGDYVQPKLILQKLVEQFLKRLDPSIKRELYYWHAYYDKRVPTGPSALLKLEEFVAKFMSIYRRSSSNR